MYVHYTYLALYFLKKSNMALTILINKKGRE